MGNADDRMCPHNAYRTAREGAWVSLAVASEEEWTALKGALGLPELSDPAFATPVERRRNVARLDALIEGWTGRREPEEIAARLQRAGVAALRVLDGAQAGRQPQAQARGVLEAVEHPLIGVRQVVGAPWRFGRDRVGVRSPAPLLGQHNDYVLSEILGLAPDEIERLRESGVLN
jgi:crotonobetainyl-CoA:carnitine CoA-transferase CaiB-like acyl-CoA transferase